jgi:hypothetical protein
MLQHVVLDIWPLKYLPFTELCLLTSIITWLNVNKKVDIEFNAHDALWNNLHQVRYCNNLHQVRFFLFFGQVFVFDKRNVRKDTTTKADTICKIDTV